MASWAIYHGKYRLVITTLVDGAVSVEAFIQEGEEWRHIKTLELRAPVMIDGVEIYG